MTDEDDHLACDYVLDRLDPEAHAALVKRIANDPGFRGRVREFEVGLRARVSELPEKAPSPQVWDRIALAAGAGHPDSAIRWVPIMKWAIVAVIAISLASLAAERWLNRPYVVILALDAGSTRPVRLALSQTGNPNASFIQLASLAAARWENPKDRRAFALFDPVSSQGFIAVRELPAPGQGRRYQVWILNTGTGTVRAAGALPTSGLYSFAIDPFPEGQADQLRVLVTREASALPPTRPGTDVILGG